MNMEIKLLSSAKENIGKSRELYFDGQDINKESEKLLTRSRNVLSTATSHFRRLADTLEAMERKSERLEGSDPAIAADLEGYRLDFVVSCLANAERLEQSAERLEAMIGESMGVGAEETLRAARVYQVG